MSAVASRLARSAFDRVVGDDIHVVRVLSGAALGSRLALDLTKEKAYWFGTYERAAQRFLRASITQGDVFYDIGAHVGFFSVCAARLGATVVAVEPDPGNAARLRRNVLLNGLEVRVVEAAAWHEAGEVAYESGASTKEGRVERGRGTRSVTIDELAASGRPPTLIKLDVEGAEAAALAGAEQVLKSCSAIVICEIHGAQRDLVLGKLHGYEFEPLDEGERVIARPAGARMPL